MRREDSQDCTALDYEAFRLVWPLFHILLVLYILLLLLFFNIRFKPALSRFILLLIRKIMLYLYRKESLYIYLDPCWMSCSVHCTQLNKKKKKVPFPLPDTPYLYPLPFTHDPQLSLCQCNMFFLFVCLLICWISFTFFFLTMDFYLSGKIRPARRLSCSFSSY